MVNRYMAIILHIAPEEGTASHDTEQKMREEKEFELLHHQKNQ